LNVKKLIVALVISFTVAVTGFIIESSPLIAVGAAAALISSAVYFYNSIKKRNEKNTHIEQQELKEKIKQVNFPVFMNNVKQKYGEVILKYRLPQKPTTLDNIQYWCCDDFLIFLPEWNYYQDLIYQKYKDSILNENEEKKLLDDICVIHKRDILYFEKSREHHKNTFGIHRSSKRYERAIPLENVLKTCISYRKSGLITEKYLPEAAYDILMELIPDKVKTPGVIFPGK
jgi:hypothetical protein